ncbi:MAG: PAS domain-containing protein [Longimonas sp.]|uniref:PAS domain-containing sensor histidine kinase n=1 Tax=Longimonas sp. TaxID=2039626 RepID=UPI00335EE93D
MTRSSLRVCIADLPAPVVLLDADGNIEAESDRWRRTFRILVPGAPQDVSLFELIDDPDGAWHEALQRCIDESRVLQGKQRVMHFPEAGPRWVDWEMRPVPSDDDAETVTHAVLFTTDRTSERQTDRLRQQVEARFDTLLDTIQEGALLMDSDGIFRDCNDTVPEIFGRPRSEIIGSHFGDSKWTGLRPDGTPLANTEFPFWVAYYERKPVMGEVMGIYPPDAPPRWIRVNARPLFELDEEDPYGVFICFEDITNEQLKDEALQTSRDVLSSVLTSSLDGIVVYSAVRDTRGTIVDFECVLVNPQGEKLLKISAEEMVGTKLLELLPEHADQGLFDAYVNVVRTGEPYERELRLADTEGGTTWCQVMAVKIEDGIAVTFRDISERREAAQAMSVANEKLEQRNRALRDFAYIASHDLQEPLRKISAFSNLVVEDYGDKVDDTGKHYLDRMQDAAQRMSQLISDLLVYSRITTQARPFKPVDLNQIVANVLNDLSMRIEDVEGTVEVGDLATIEADSTQMRQLLQNLIGNALKFHRPDVPPRITVDTIMVDRDTLNGGPPVATSSNTLCRLRITDNGIGFEAKYVDRIFTPFQRLHGRGSYEGTGMGLAICRRIVERHGGSIGVESVPDEGSTFTVWLPAEHSSASNDTSTAPDEHDQFTTEKILDE